MQHLYNGHFSSLKLVHVVITTVSAQLLKSEAGVFDGGSCALAQGILGKKLSHMISFYKASFFFLFPTEIHKVKNKFKC